MARPARVVVRAMRHGLRPVCYRAQRVTFPFFLENPRSNPPIDAIVRGKSPVAYLRVGLALVSCSCRQLRLQLQRFDRNEESWSKRENKTEMEGADILLLERLGIDAGIYPVSGNGKFL